ncbi:MAG: diguanylate cyclase [Acidobacteriota bacterium]|jgi:diguanylate cyclase (GGDEF)-like protein|nr:diguanylate cyclase [Acidobacteriota bacterium]
MTHSQQHKLQITGVLTVAVFFAVVLGIVLWMTQKNSEDLREMLDSSIQSRLVSTAHAALEIIDADRFETYNTVADTVQDADAYQETLARLRKLQQDTGSKYIYALKQLDDGEYYFVFDTDLEDQAILQDEGPYEMEDGDLLGKAFLGKESVDMDMQDEWGRYHTGAVPIRKNNKVIGVIGVDIDNTLWEKSNESARNNIWYLTIAVGLAMLVMLLLTSILLRRLQSAQDKLFRLANYDVVTGLPNRQYLMNYLAKIASANNKEKAPFALLFVDLDNFKKVNDNAGHDAGDALLRHIAAYLDGVHENSKAFRPAAGVLNVSARVGGDEFIQVFPGVATGTDAAIIAQKILDNFSSQALDRYIEKYKVGLSIGIALYPFHSDNYNVLIKYADIAMYHAKRDGKNTYCVYEDEMRGKDA